MNEPRTWTLKEDVSSYGATEETIREIEVVEKAAFDVVVAERDALVAGYPALARERERAECAEAVQHKLAEAVALAITELERDEDPITVERHLEAALDAALKGDMAPP